MMTEGKKMSGGRKNVSNDAGPAPKPIAMNPATDSASCGEVTGYLIEARDGDGLHLWWCGHGGECGNSWTRDPDIAIRLARREDAQRLVATIWTPFLSELAKIEITEHAWH